MCILQKKIIQASILSIGWEWHEYDDGSGSLRHDGESYFIYDIPPRTPYIEYKFNSDSKWDFFWGTFDEFKIYAEKTINRNLTANQVERNNMKYYIEYEHLYEVKRKHAICTREQLVELLKNPLYSLYMARLFNPELDNYDNVEELIIR